MLYKNMTDQELRKERARLQTKQKRIDNCVETLLCNASRIESSINLIRSELDRRFHAKHKAELGQT